MIQNLNIGSADSSDSDRSNERQSSLEKDSQKYDQVGKVKIDHMKRRIRSDSSDESDESIPVTKPKKKLKKLCVESDLDKKIFQNKRKRVRFRKGDDASSSSGDSFAHQSNSNHDKPKMKTTKKRNKTSSDSNNDSDDMTHSDWKKKSRLSIPSKNNESEKKGKHSTQDSTGPASELDISQISIAQSASCHSDQENEPQKMKKIMQINSSDESSEEKTVVESEPKESKEANKSKKPSKTSHKNFGKTAVANKPKNVEKLTKRLKNMLPLDDQDKRVKWTSQQQQAFGSAFKMSIKKGTYPSASEIRSAQSQFPCLKRKSTDSITSRLQNIFRKDAVSVINDVSKSKVKK